MYQNTVVPTLRVRSPLTPGPATVVADEHLIIHNADRAR